jgi:hypothetical protein
MLIAVAYDDRLSKIAIWKTRIKLFRLYFDGVDAETVADVTRDAKRLGGVHFYLPRRS